MKTTEHFLGRAETVLARAGGNPALAGALADWARAADGGNPRRGVVVTIEGAVIAETVFVNGSAYRVMSSAVLADVQNRELDTVLPRLGKATGRKVLHVTYAEVCQGAGRSLACSTV